MSEAARVEVAIVGAGPVGALLSAELARHGVSAEMFEQRAEPGAGARAVGVHATALAAMEASGVTDRLLDDALRVRAGEARQGGRTLGVVRFDRLHARHPYVATLPQSATEAAIAAAAARWGAAPPLRGCRVSALVTRAGAVEVQTDAGEALLARIVVVAGGLRARDLLPVAVRGRHYPDRYLMTDCADTGDDGERAVVHLDAAGVLESFPLPGGRRRYVAWVDPAASASGAGAGALRAAVAARTGSDAAASAVETATGFGVARSRLATFRTGRVIAIGDTAHEVSPIGGQGMNLGLLDAVTLAPLLARWVREGAPPDTLVRWERERVRAADRAARIAAVNTALGRPAGAGARVGARVDTGADVGAGASGHRAAARAGAGARDVSDPRGGGVRARAVHLALATPAATLLAHAYAMGFDPAAGRFHPVR